jgi:hypothetical protein
VIDWRALAVDKARALGSADPEKSADLILHTVRVADILDDVCYEHGCGGVPPFTTGKCVDYEAHHKRFQTDGEAQKAWAADDILPEHRLGSEFPCADIEAKAPSLFQQAIEENWYLLEPGGLVDNLQYILDNINSVPPTIQSGWKTEMRALLGRAPAFADFNEREASWLRHKMAGYVASRQKKADKATDKSSRSKRRSKSRALSQRQQGAAEPTIQP